MRRAEQIATFEPRGIAKLIREGVERREYRLRTPQGSVLHRLVLEVLGARRAAWRVTYDVRKGATRSRHKIKIGDASTPLPTVNERWHEAVAKIEAGGDPAGDAAATNVRGAELADMTFDILVADYLAAKAKLRWLPELQRLVAHDLLPRLGKLPAAAITPLDIEAAVEVVTNRGAPAAARTVYVACKGIFAWGLGKAKWRHAGLATNPAAAITGPAAPAAKTRKLSDDELRLFWSVLDAGEGFEPGTADAFRLVLLLARRANEVLGAAWAEIELDRPDPLWRLPPERSKNGREVLIPLAGRALAILAQRRAANTDGHRFVFPGRGGKSLTEGVMKTALRRLFEPRTSGNTTLQALLPPPPFSTHDLRRTVANRASEELDYSQETIAALLGHAAANVTDAHYSQASKIKRVRLLVTAWDAHLTAILSGEAADTGGNVVRLRAGGGDGG